MTTPNLNQEWEKEFDERFGPEKIWVVPSQDNIKTMEEIKLFISNLLSRELEAQRDRILHEIYSTQKVGAEGIAEIVNLPSLK